MAQWVKWLLFKPEDPSLDPTAYVKSLSERHHKEMLTWCLHFYFINKVLLWLREKKISRGIWKSPKQRKGETDWTWWGLGKLGGWERIVEKDGRLWTSVNAGESDMGPLAEKNSTFNCCTISSVPESGYFRDWNFNASDFVRTVELSKLFFVLCCDININVPSWGWEKKGSN